jgi:hypothetical protein
MVEKSLSLASHLARRLRVDQPIAGLRVVSTPDCASLREESVNCGIG